MILILPMPIIWKLNNTTTNKIGLSAVFAMGILYVYSTYPIVQDPLSLDWAGSTDQGLTFVPCVRDIIVGILRIVSLVALGSSPDYTFAAINTWVWSVLEPGLAVIVACAPTFPPLIAALRHMRRSSRPVSWTGQKLTRSYSHQHQQSNSSESEHPLGLVYGNAWSSNGRGNGRGKGKGGRTASRDKLDIPESASHKQGTHDRRKDQEQYLEDPRIKVKTHISVESSRATPDSKPVDPGSIC